MHNITTNFTQLLPYLSTLHANPDYYRPSCCPHCGNAKLWKHGHYDRKPDRDPGGGLNPIPILRFLSQL